MKKFYNAPPREQTLRPQPEQRRLAGAPARGPDPLAGGSGTVSAAPQNTRPHLRILIVDDSAIIVHCLCEYLDDQPAVQVIGTATNGSDGVRQAVLLKPDLVLMDVNMPGMNGLQATALLRQQLINTRIILMTLDETDAYKAAAHAQGAHGFIAKERLANDLMSEIHRVGQLPNIGSEKHCCDLPALDAPRRSARAAEPMRVSPHSRRPYAGV